METIKQIKEEFLVCPICIQRYSSPKLLPCLHTFCKDCLAKSLNKLLDDSQPEVVISGDENCNETSKCFSCPVCRSEIQLDIPIGNRNVQQWAEVFPDNHFIESLMEKLDMHSTEKHCESCSIEGQSRRNKAENWCQTCKIAFCQSCINAHNVIKACREHVVISLEDMRSNPMQSILSTRKDIPCSYHRDKIIEFYCVDCHAAICSSCVAVQHRRCEMVETVSDAVQKLKPETEYVYKDLLRQREILSEWASDHSKELSGLADNKTHLIAELSDVRSKINELLLNLENKLIGELEEKHKSTMNEVDVRLKDVDEMKKNVENTDNLLQNLMKFGSDSEILSLFDTIKVQVDDMRSAIQKAKLNKLNTRYKFSIDPCLQRILEMKSFGRIIDVVDLNKENYLSMNGYDEDESQNRTGTIKRTGTFRVEKPSGKSSTPTNSLSSTSSESVSSQEAAPVPPRRRNTPMRGVHKDNLKPNERIVPNRAGTLPRQPRTPRYPSVNRAKSHSNADIREEKTNRDSIKSSVRNLNNENRRDSVRTSTQRNVLSPERKADSEITSQGNISRTSRTSIKPPLPPEATVTPFSPPTGRRNIEKKEQGNVVASSVTSKSQPSRSKSIEDVIDDTIPMPKTQNQEQNRDEGMSFKKIESLNSSIPSDSLNGQLQQTPVNSNGNHISPSNTEPQSNTPPRPLVPAKPDMQKSKSIPLLFSFNGKTDGDSKKCWPIDIAVLEDGTPIITDFHNKKIKAFDPSGCVVGEASVPSWPHGIVDISSTELVVTLPELSTLIFVILKDEVMRIRKRIRTAKQYRGVACDAFSVPGNPCIVVSCCSSGGQCVDVLTVDGAILQTYRDDYRQHGRLLFTWPYYICTNNQGEIVVSDCQSRNNLICLGRNGKARYEESMNESVIKDPRGMCTDRLGNVLIADKNGNAIHMLGIDGKYKYVVMTSNDGLVSPIAVCLSPFGHLIVTQENGDIKVFKF